MAGRHAKKSTNEPLDGMGPTGTHKRKTKWIVLLTVLALIVVLGGIGYYFLSQPLSHRPTYPKYPGSTTPPPQATAEQAGRTNVLLIGTDTRPGEKGGNTDVLILASLDPKNHRIEMLSIPRDTKVLFPDGSYAKINEGLSIGGPQLTESLVAQLTGQPIDDYALTHFGGLVQVIDTIGGITVNVPERMYYNTGDKEYNIINLKPGVQKLSGAQALGFVRFRHDALGDIGRTERQQEFLKALTQQLLQPSNITKLPTLIHEFWGTLDTDMSLLDVLKLASHAETYRDYQIINETLPGSFHNPDPSIPDDESYWIVNPLQAQYAAKHFFEDGQVQKNPVQDPSVTQNWTPPAPQSVSNATGNVTGNAAGNTATTDNQTSVSATNNSGITEMVVSGSSANIRSGPATTYSIVASVVNGQTVTVIGHSGDWDEVIVGNGITGYIADWLLSSAS